MIITKYEPVKYTADGKVDRDETYYVFDVAALSDALDAANAERKRLKAENAELQKRLDDAVAPTHVARPELEALEIARSRDESTVGPVYFYERDHYVLSNFSAFTLQWNGSVYPTSEHAYQAQKFLPDRPDIAERIYRAPSAHVAFKIAEQERENRRPDWDAVKVDVMRAILTAKAQQHDYVMRKLLSTGDRELIENSWRDGYWGWGQNHDGTNMLGRLWMEVRGAAALGDSQPASNPKGF